MPKPKPKKKIPYEFVLEELDRLSPWVRPMFGCHAVYVGEKIVLILRQKEASDPDNGIWIATTVEHHASLKRDFKSMRPIEIFKDGGPQGWQNLPEESSDFEEEALKICALIRKNDPRLGKVPVAKKRKRAKKSPTRKK